MSRQLVNSTDLASRVALLEKRCDGLFQMVQALQAARGADVLKANSKPADPFAGYGFGGHYDLNELQQEGDK
jgi:hypothetical protein